jgi:pimeloyl-ACP methyl ester carboxylesterase
LKPDIIFHQGDKNKPLAVFIHGIGMDANVWADPESARVLGGKYPLRILLGGIEMKNSFDDLRDLGFPVLTWSQKRPVGEAAAALEELEEIVNDYISDGIILIGHSRGGLLARKLVEHKIHNIRAIVTIATPHHGSTVAKWADHISPFAATLKKIVDAGHKRESASAIQRVLGFLSGSGIKEMLPDSDFISSLSSQPASGTKTISIGGTDPSLVVINGRPLSAIISGILPDSMLPDELREGMGDGFVSAVSSVWPGAHEHRNFHAHHVRLLFNPEVREYIREIVNAHT